MNGFMALKPGNVQINILAIERVIMGILSCIASPERGADSKQGRTKWDVTETDVHSG